MDQKAEKGLKALEYLLSERFTYADCARFADRVIIPLVAKVEEMIKDLDIRLSRLEAEVAELKKMGPQ